MDCLVRSAAFAAGISVDILIEYIGHDGLEIIYPDLAWPYCCRGYCLPEIFEALFNLGFACVDIPKTLITVRSMASGFHVLDDVDHLEPYLMEPRYILYGGSHAIGINNNKIFDLMGKVQTIQDFDYDGIVIIKHMSSCLKSFNLT